MGICQANQIDDLNEIKIKQQQSVNHRQKLLDLSKSTVVVIDGINSVNKDDDDDYISIIKSSKTGNAVQNSSKFSLKFGGKLPLEIIDEIEREKTEEPSFRNLNSRCKSGAGVVVNNCTAVFPAQRNNPYFTNNSSGTIDKINLTEIKSNQNQTQSDILSMDGESKRSKVNQYSERLRNVSFIKARSSSKKRGQKMRKIKPWEKLEALKIFDLNPSAGKQRKQDSISIF